LECSLLIKSAHFLPKLKQKNTGKVCVSFLRYSFDLFLIQNQIVKPMTDSTINVEINMRPPKFCPGFVEDWRRACRSKEVICARYCRDGTARLGVASRYIFLNSQAGMIARPGMKSTWLTGRFSSLPVFLTTTVIPLGVVLTISVISRAVVSIWLLCIISKDIGHDAGRTDKSYAYRYMPWPPCAFCSGNQYSGCKTKSG